MRTTTLPPPTRHPLVRHDAFWVVVAAVVAVVVTLPATRPPDTVASFTVDNPTRWDLGASVSASPEGPRSPLPLARAGTRTSAPDVLDRGGTWFLHLSTGGIELDPVRLDRADLEARDWVVLVPDDLADELERASGPAR